MSCDEKGGVSPESLQLIRGAGAPSKICEACSAGFQCGAEAGICWCDAVKLDAAVLAELCLKFSDCLCPECLNSRAREKSPS